MSWHLVLVTYKDEGAARKSGIDPYAHLMHIEEADSPEEAAAAMAFRSDIEEILVWDLGKPDGVYVQGVREV